MRQLSYQRLLVCKETQRWQRQTVVFTELKSLWFLNHSDVTSRLSNQNGSSGGRISVNNPPTHIDINVDYWSH